MTTGSVKSVVNVMSDPIAPPLANVAQRLRFGLFGDRECELIGRGDHGDRAQRDGFPKRSFTAQGQSQRRGGIDHRDLDLAAGDLRNRCRAVAAEKSDRPAVAALLAQVDARLTVAPLRLIDQLGGDLEHQPRPYGISADYTIFRFIRSCQTVLLVCLTKISKHEIRNSKQFQMTKLGKQTSFALSDLSFFRFELYLPVTLFRISIFGFRILFAATLI